MGAAPAVVCASACGGPGTARQTVERAGRLGGGNRDGPARLSESCCVHGVHGACGVRRTRSGVYARSESAVPGGTRTALKSRVSLSLRR